MPNEPALKSLMDPRALVIGHSLGIGHRVIGHFLQRFAKQLENDSGPSFAAIPYAACAAATCTVVMVLASPSPREFTPTILNLYSPAARPVAT